MEIRIISSIWGKGFADIFVRWSLPSILTYRNYNEVISSGYKIKFYIYGDDKTLADIRKSETVCALDNLSVVFFPISQTFFNGKPLDSDVKRQGRGIDTHELQSRCYMHGMEQPVNGDVAFMFWTADFILSDGGLSWAISQIESGCKAVYADYIEISQERATDELDICYSNLGKGASGRELARIAIDHTHQITLDQFCDDGSISAYPPFIFLTGDKNSIVHTGIFPHPLLVVFDSKTTRFESSIDYEFAQRVVGDMPYAKALDSDDLLLCTVTPGIGYGPSKREKLTADFLARFLITEANQVHFELAQRIGIIHTSFS